MMSFIKLLPFLLCVYQVRSMALKGTPLTRYDPCGLGVIHFDKITEKLWRGTVNLGLYENLKKDVTIELIFDNQVFVNGVSVKTTLTATEDWRQYEFKFGHVVPYRFSFFVNLNEDDTSFPTVKKLTLNKFVLCDDAIKASQTIDALNVTKEHDHYKHICGRRSLNHAELTSVRTESQAGDWPWHVAILVRDLKTNETHYECGGSIVSRTTIVTAAHCVQKVNKLLDASEVVIVAGVNNHNDYNQVGRQELNAVKVIVHPSYTHTESTADLALIKVKHLRYTEYVQPVCLWGPVYDKTNLFGYQATVVGFGRTEDNVPTDFLRSAYTLVQNDTVCIDYDQQLYEPLLNEFTFCAGFGPDAGINPRNGDSGGGLVVPTMQHDHKLSWFLRGVLSKCGVSNGHTSCDPSFYMVYTDVGPHYGWIYHHSGLEYATNIVY